MVGLLLVILIFVVLRNEHAAWARSLSASPQEFTGWALLVLVGGLALLNLRKKVTRLPLLRAYIWTTLHVYLGLFCGLVFLLHMGLVWPSAALNQILLVIFTLLFLSGIVGLFLSRWVPRRIRHRGEELILERIPAFRAQLARELDAVVEREMRESENLAMAEFAVEHLMPFFSRPMNRLGHLFRSHQSEQLLFRLNAVGRYLNPKEQAAKDRLVELILAKDDLDYTEAHQNLLKYWLFLHVPLTYALLIYIPVHIAWGLILH